MPSRYLLLIWMWLVTPSMAWAHALGAECKMRGDQVVVEAYFDDDTPARAALVKVMDEAKKLHTEGKTDGQGHFEFLRPAPGKYEVIVDAGGGHRVQIAIQVPGSNEGTKSSPVVSRSSEDSGGTISSGPKRTEFTSYPWLKVALGVGSIGAFSLAFWLSRRKR